MTTASLSSTSSSSSLPSWGRVARLSCIAAVAAIHIMASAPSVVAQKEDKEKENGANRATPCMDKPANSCLECLNDSTTGQLDPAGCAWAPGFGCLSSCSIIADVECYAGKDGDKDNNKDNNKDGTEICARADSAVANEEFCYGMTDCASCTSAALPDGSGGTCHWFGEEFGMPAGGWCGGPGCNMIGCGSPTCPGETGGAAAADASGNGSHNKNNNADSEPEEIDIVSPPPPADEAGDVAGEDVDAGADADADADAEDKQVSPGGSSSEEETPPPPPPPEPTKPGPAGTGDSSSPSTTTTAIISEGFSTAIGAYTGALLLLLGLAPIWWAA